MMRKVGIIICLWVMAGIVAFSVLRGLKKFRGDEGGVESGSVAPTPVEKPDPTGSPEAEARKALAENRPWRAFEVLEARQTDEAFRILLGMLELPEAQTQTRVKVVELLAGRTDHHDEIAAAYAKLLPHAFSSEIYVICRSFAAWDKKQYAVDLAGYLTQSNRWDYYSAVTGALFRIGTPECVPILLAPLPATAADRQAFSAKLESLDKPTTEAMARLEHIVPVLGELRDPRAAPLLLDYFNAYDSQKYLSVEFRLWEPVCIALGKIGTDEAIAAMEARVDAEKNPDAKAWLLSRVRPGLMRSRHIRGRALLDQALASTNDFERGDAVGALVGSVWTQDVARVIRVVEDTNPLYAQQGLELLPKVVSADRAGVEKLGARLAQAKRWRSALRVAEALGDTAGAATAQKELETLRKAVDRKPRLDRWIGEPKEAVQKALKGGKLEQGGLAMVVNGVSYWSWSYDVPDTGLWMSGSMGGSCGQIVAKTGYADPVYGVRLGDSAMLAWELHGPSRSTGTHELWYRISHGKEELYLAYNFDLQGRVVAATLRRD